MQLTPWPTSMLNSNGMALPLPYLEICNKLLSMKEGEESPSPVFSGLLLLGLSTVFDTLSDSLRGTLSSVGAQDGTVCSPASPV